MKKTPLLNIAVSELIASLGHGDTIVIADAGLPVPADVQLIDLALTRGVPSFMDTLTTVLSEMEVGHHLLADELAENSPQLAEDIDALNLTDKRTLSHTEFKRLTHNARAVIRTGEFTPYANIILVAGVVF
ncbi:MAG: D-ribose pyranase [Glaciimonas sp.]|nr:D-ribose pyranase [Glaciimonas sp.]